MRRIARAGSCTAILVLGYFAGSTAAKTGKGGPKSTPAIPAVMWRDPVDISSRDLYYGPGGKEHEPKGTFTFEKEDMGGTNPKFDVVDEAGVKWKVKMGAEARPETAASR